MPGKTGMTHRTPRRTAVRRQIWRSIRIFRRFTLPDLMRSIPKEVSYGNVRKFVKQLTIHGYVAQNGDYVGGREGVYQQYRLLIDAGPEYPTQCRRCGASVTTGFCDKKEEEKERKENTKTQGGTA